MGYSSYASYKANKGYKGKGIVKTYDLSKAIMQELEFYSRSIIDGMNEVGDSASKEAIATLKETSPKKTKTYSKSWRVQKMTFINAPGRFTVHNKDRYRLTHLLEKGHATRDGGRTTPQVHIKPVEEKFIDDYVKGVEEVIKRGY